MPDSTRQNPDIDPRDADLVGRCVRGDTAARRALVSRYGTLVYAVLRQYGLPPDVRDDVFQEVFVIVVRQLPTLREFGSLSRWLVVITNREVLRWVRRSARHAIEGDPPAAVPLPDSEIEALEDRQRVRDALSDLGEPCRSLLETLFSPRKPDYATVAHMLGLPVGSIGPMRGRCLARLQACLEQRERRPTDGSVSPGPPSASLEEGARQ